MAVLITVDNETFEYPTAADSPGWGEEATATIVKIAEVLNSLKSADDILLTSFTVANNQAVATNVNGLAFNNSTVRGAFIDYTVYRVTGTNEAAECGRIEIIYKNVANSWELNRTFAGDAQTIFTITSGGQLQYTSSNLSGSGYTGVMKFKAVTFPQ